MVAPDAYPLSVLPDELMREWWSRPGLVPVLA
jgi:hypothetical protein